MPIHGLMKPLPRSTNVGGEMVDLESTDYREQQYRRNQQTEARPRYVMVPPGVMNQEPDVAPVSEPTEPDEALTKAINEDLRKRGVSSKPKKTKTTD